MNAMVREYRRWCERTFPDYRVSDFPLRGRMYETWCAAWTAAMQTITKGETK